MSSQGPLQGRIEYHDSLFSRILHGVAGVLKDVGGAVIDHAPGILQGVMTGLAATSLNQSRNIMPDTSRSLDFGSSPSSNHRISTPNLSTYQSVEIPQYKPSTIARDALQRVKSQRRPVEIPAYKQRNPLSGLVRQNMGQIAQPQYRLQTPDAEIHNDHQQSNEVFLRALDPNFGRDSSAPIQEDWTQIQRNLAYAQRPLTQAEVNARYQQHLENTRPLDENLALQQMSRRANEARHKPVPQPSEQKPGR